MQINIAEFRDFLKKAKMTGPSSLLELSFFFRKDYIEIIGKDLAGAIYVHGKFFAKNEIEKSFDISDVHDFIKILENFEKAELVFSDNKLIVCDDEKTFEIDLEINDNEIEEALSKLNFEVEIKINAKVFNDFFNFAKINNEDKFKFVFDKDELKLQNKKKYFFESKLNIESTEVFSISFGTPLKTALKELSNIQIFFGKNKICKIKVNEENYELFFFIAPLVEVV